MGNPDGSNGGVLLRAVFANLSQEVRRAGVGGLSGWFDAAGVLFGGRSLISHRSQTAIQLIRRGECFLWGVFHKRASIPSRDTVT